MGGKGWGGNFDWGFVWGCIPVNAQGDQKGCIVSGDGPGVQRDWVGVCVCVWGGRRKTWVRVYLRRSSQQSAAGLRASYGRRGLQAVKPSARRGRGELKASTPPHFRAASAMDLLCLGFIIQFFFHFCQCHYSILGKFHVSPENDSACSSWTALVRKRVRN